MAHGYPDGVLDTPFRIGPVEVPNRVLLAPLAGIGNWFVRLQARRHGAGLAVSEMVSSFAIHHRNDKTMNELLRIHPDEGPVSIQLFGQDPDVMRSAAETVAAARRRDHRPEHGLPGAEGLQDRRGRRADQGSRHRGGGRARGRRGQRAPGHGEAAQRPAPGETDGYALAHRLVEEAGVAAIGFHPRSAAVHHKGMPDYDLAARLVESLAGAGDPDRRPARPRVDPRRLRAARAPPP